MMGESIRMITCTCPECDEELEVGERKLGKTIECPECGAEFKVSDKRKKRAKRRRRGKGGASNLSTADLRQVALFQRAIMFCIVAYLGVVASQFAIPPESRSLLLFIAVPVVVASAAFVFLLSVKLYQAVGVVLGLLALVPLLGLIILLIVNQKATDTLRGRGYRVGFLGAPLSQFDDREDEEDEEED
jgi:ssDNA-binding Zn-finger/Zn-ribbon topoisomerase 1